MQALLKLPVQDPGLAAKIIKNKKIDLNIPESVNSTRFAEVWEELPVLQGLLDAFSGLPDPRCRGRTHHRLIDIVIIAVCAVISGAETWVDIALYGCSKENG